MASTRRWSSSPEPPASPTTRRWRGRLLANVVEGIDAVLLTMVDALGDGTGRTARCSAP